MTGPWTYQLEPVEMIYRLYEDKRVVGAVLKEADAKLICEAVNKYYVPPGA